MTLLNPVWTQSIGLCTGDSRWRRPTLRLALHSSYISRRLCCIRDVLCVLVIPWPRTCPAISHVPVFPLRIFLSNPDMRNSSSLYIFFCALVFYSAAGFHFRRRRNIPDIPNRFPVSKREPVLDYILFFFLNPSPTWWWDVPV